jgi:hypothetical protein
MTILCIKYRRFEKNTLRGFVDLQLTRVGLVIRDCTWHRHPDGKEWVGFPARSYVDENGGTHWVPLIEFAEGARKAREEFREQAIKAIHAAVADEEPVS